MYVNVNIALLAVCTDIFWPPVQVLRGHYTISNSEVKLQ